MLLGLANGKNDPQFFNFARSQGTHSKALFVWLACMDACETQSHTHTIQTLVAMSSGNQSTEAVNATSGCLKTVCENSASENLTTVVAMTSGK